MNEDEQTLLREKTMSEAEEASILARGAATWDGLPQSAIDVATAVAVGTVCASHARKTNRASHEVGPWK